MEARFRVWSEWDVAAARIRARELALALGFGPGDAALIATALSEVGSNMVVHARGGLLTVHWVEQLGLRGLEVVAEDQGPGISDPALAMEDGYSTIGSLGLGLPGAKRMMDNFVLESAPGRGTKVTMRKWVPPPLVP